MEARRPSRWNSEYRNDARRYLDGEEIGGWEAQQDVVHRVGESLDDHRRRAGNQRLIVVGHGISAALWVAATLGIDAARWWKSLRFPDAWEIDLQALRAIRIDALS